MPVPEPDPHDVTQGGQGWEVGAAQCPFCRFRWTAVAPVARAPVGFECPNCHHQAGAFIEAARGIGPDEEGE